MERGRKSTQHERLLAGMILAANRDGYAHANVSEVIAEAGVSRPTFYDYFNDKDDCFVAAVTDTHERLLSAVPDVRLVLLIRPRGGVPAGRSRHGKSGADTPGRARCSPPAARRRRPGAHSAHE